MVQENLFLGFLDPPATCKILNGARSGSIVTLTEHTSESARHSKQHDDEYIDEHDADDEMMVILPSVA